MSILSDRPPPVISDSTAAIRNALRMIPNPDADPEIQSGVAWAIKGALGPSGICVWLDWSRKSEAHRDSSAELIWNLANDQHDQNLLFALAYLQLTVRGMSRGVS